MTDNQRADTLVAAYRGLDPAGPELDLWDTPAARTAVLDRIPQPTAPTSHRRVSSPRRRRYALITAGAVATACAALLVVGAVELPGDVSTTQPASAAQLLTDAAAVARDLPPLPPLTGTQRVYTAHQSDSPFYTLGSDRFLFESWTATDSKFLGTRTQLAHPTQPLGDVYVQRSEGSTEGVPSSPAALAAVPTAPDALRGYVEKVARTSPSSFATEHRRVLMAMNLLNQPFAPPALRAGLFDYLASFPGAQNAGTSTDALGRTGTQVDLPFAQISGVTDQQYTDVATVPADQRATMHLLFDPATASMLELRLVHSPALVRRLFAKSAKAIGLPSPLPEPTLEQRTETWTYIAPVIVDRERERPAGVVVAGGRLQDRAVTTSGASTAP